MLAQHDATILRWTNMLVQHYATMLNQRHATMSDILGQHGGSVITDVFRNLATISMIIELIVCFLFIVYCIGCLIHI